MNAIFYFSFCMLSWQAGAQSLFWLNIRLSIPLKMWCTKERVPFGDEARGGKLVPDETGSGEWRQREPCFRQGKEDRPDIDAQSALTPWGIQRKIFLSLFT